VRVRTRGTLLGQKVEFGVHIRYQTAAANAEDLAASWTATIMPLVVAATSTDANWEQVVVSDTSSTGLESVVLPLTQPNPGTVIGDSLPPQDAAVISLRTGSKGGRKRGRFYLPGLTENYQQDGQMMGAQLTAIQALGNGIVEAYGAGGSETAYRLVVYSPEVLTFPEPKPKKPRPGRIITDVTSYVVSPVIRTQRRRSIGLGA
jgi:hypothetical protein